LKIKIIGLVEENTILNSKLESYKKSLQMFNDESGDGARRQHFTHEILTKIERQIEGYKNEINHLRSILETADKTIDTLNKEILTLRQQVFQGNSVFEMKEKYKNVVKILQDAVEKYRGRADKQTDINLKLQKENEKLEKNAENLREELEKKNMELNIMKEKCADTAKLEEKLYQSMQDHKNLKASYRKLERSLLEVTERENSALMKVQEALLLAEAAVAEKKMSDERIQSLEEEYASLAATISNVMEEAAAKVDGDVQKLHNIHFDRERALLEYNNQLKEELKSLKKTNKNLEERCSTNMKCLKETLDENKNLIKELELTQSQVSELTEKVENHGHFLREGKESLTDHEIENFIQVNKDIKEKYKNTIKDLSSKFEVEMTKLKRQNETLINQLRLIKLKESF